MESTECIAAHSIARTILLHSAAITAATSSRTADSPPAGVSRASAVLVMGLLNQPPPTVLRPPNPLCTRDPRTFGNLSARSRYARWRSLLDHRNHRRTRPARATSYRASEPEFGGRVGKALWRLTVSRPHPRRALGTSPGLDTLAGARYSTTEYALLFGPGYGDVPGE